MRGSHVLLSGRGGRDEGKWIEVTVMTLRDAVAEKTILDRDLVAIFSPVAF